MTETTNVRQERIEKLLRELEYEVTRGMMEKEIGEEMGFRFYVQISSKIQGGVVLCEFRTRPNSSRSRRATRSKRPTRRRSPL